MRALLGILICLCAQQVLADTRYVSDNIFTYIHNGPGTQYRILGSVKAGEPLEVKAVNNDAGFTQVVDGRGREGWIKNSELQVLDVAGHCAHMSHPELVVRAMRAYLH